MSDIIERSLNLSVVAEDEASDVFAALADQVDDFQERFETAFDAMQVYAEDTAQSIAEVGNSWAPVWIGQLEALEQASNAVFTTLEAEFDAVAKVAAQSGSSIADAFSAGNLGIDAASGSLSDLDTQLTTAGTDGAAAGDKIASAFSSDNLGLDVASGALSDLDEQLKTAGDDAATAADKIAEGFSSDSLGLDAASGSLSDLDGQLKATGDDAATAADKIAEAFDSGSLGLDAAKGSLDSLDEQFNTAADDGTTAADKIGKAFTSSLDASATSAQETWAAMFDKLTADGRASAEAIDEAYSSVGAVGGGELAAGGAAGAAGDDAAIAEGAGVEGVSLASKGADSGDFSIPGLPSMSAVLTGGIGAAIGLGAVDLATQQLEGLEALKAQTGGSWTQTLELAAAGKGADLSSSQLQTYIQRLDKNIGEITQKEELSEGLEGSPESLGLGKNGINPDSLQTYISGGSGAALALSALGISANELDSMSGNGSQQLALIAEKIDALPTAIERNTVTSELFGRGAGADFLLAKYSQASTEAAKNLPPGLASDLQTTLGSGKSMVDLQESEFYLEVEMSAALVKMAPTLDKVFTELEKHETALEAIVGSVIGLKVIEGAINTSNSWLEKIEHVVEGKAGAAVGGAVVGGGAAATVAGGLGDVLGVLALSGSDSTEHSYAGGYPLLSQMLHSTSPNPAFTSAYLGEEKKLGIPQSDTNPFANSSLDKYMEGWLENQLVAPAKKALGGIGVDSSSQFGAMGAIEQAAARYGRNPEAMLADSYAESTLRPTAVNSTSGATGLFQFLASTWAADTKQMTGKALPFSDASNPHMNADVAAWAMKEAGVGGSRNVAAATAADINDFERPGKKGAAGDEGRAGTFLDTLTPQLEKMDTAAQTHGKAISTHVSQSMTDSKSAVDKVAPALPKDIATSLNTLVDDADKYGSQFSSKVHTHMTETKTYVEQAKPELTTAGKDAMEGLLQGLESEEGPLTAEAQHIADEIESTIKKALKISSPSEVTAEIGENLTAGLTAGIERSSHGPALAGARAGLGAAGAISAGTTGGGGSGGGGSQTVQLVIDGHVIGQIVMGYMNDQMKLNGNIPARIS